MSRNDITGDNIATKGTTDAYRDNYDRIFGALKDKGALDVAFTIDPDTKGDIPESMLRVLDVYLDGNVTQFGKIGDADNGPDVSPEMALFIEDAILAELKANT